MFSLTLFFQRRFQKSAALLVFSSSFWGMFNRASEQQEEIDYFVCKVPWGWTKHVHDLIGFFACCVDSGAPD
jgi:hypothetical protein